MLHLLLAVLTKDLSIVQKSDDGLMTVTTHRGMLIACHPFHKHSMDLKQVIRAVIITALLIKLVRNLFPMGSSSWPDPNLFIIDSWHPSWIDDNNRDQVFLTTV
jgi:hypothetical protein